MSKIGKLIGYRIQSVSLFLLNRRLPFGLSLTRLSIRLIFGKRHSPLVRAFEIPDLERPIPKNQQAPIVSAYQLKPFRPKPVEPHKIIGQQVDDICTLLGTYGMGGAGFLGLRFGTQWFVVPIQSVASWTTVNGRILENYNPKLKIRDKPWLPADLIPLRRLLIGRKITGYRATQYRLQVDIGDAILEIDGTPKCRLFDFGQQERKQLLKDDDLSKAVFLSPSQEVWI